MSDPFSNILLNHAARYPLWQIEDLYKLVHQAAMGSEHAVINPEHARRWLEEELASLVPTLPEPLVDPIAGDGGIVRVHLRPFIKLNVPADLLLDAFVQTAAAYKGSARTIEAYWINAIFLARAKNLNFKPMELIEFFDQMREKGFPAVHHSAEYEQAYRPAYRVVSRDYLPVLLKNREYL